MFPPLCTLHVCTGLYIGFTAFHLPPGTCVPNIFKGSRIHNSWADASCIMMDSWNRGVQVERCKLVKTTTYKNYGQFQHDIEINIYIYINTHVYIYIHIYQYIIDSKCMLFVHNLQGLLLLNMSCSPLNKIPKKHQVCHILPLKKITKKTRWRNKSIHYHGYSTNPP